jgi:conjugal transfer/type IV secretion protein DotA/TraY
MSHNASSTNRVASKTLRFLFAPQLFSGLNPIRSLMLSFVQIIAQFMASAQLIPSNHRSLRPQTASDARLGDVLALAYSNVRRPGARLDQWTVFMAATGLMGMLTIMLFYTIFSFMIGSANAAITITLTATGCTYTAWTSMFAATCSDDLAQQWISVLLEGTAIGSMWWGPQMNFISAPLQAGLAAMFSTYSSAMLILAGFLILYHLLVIIAGTAHEGKFGGRGMNQLWAPIRLIAAIGMLVPLGGATGFNSGQMMVTQVAKYGSSLASNVWMAFANTYTSGNYLILPPMPPVTTTVAEVLKILVCEKGMNAYGQYANMSGPPAWSVAPTAWMGTAVTSKTIKRTWDYYGGGDDYTAAACGYIEMPNPAYVPDGTAREFLTAASTINSSDTLRAALMGAHKTAIDNMIAGGSVLDSLATTLWSAVDPGGAAVVLTETDYLKINTAIVNYRNTLSTAMGTALLVSSLTSMNMAADASSRGWVSAGVWFNNVARGNGFLFDLTQIKPIAKHTLLPILSESDTRAISVAVNNVNEGLKSLPDMAASGTTTATLAELEEIERRKQFTQGKDGLDIYLAFILKNMLGMIGKGAGSGTASDEFALGAISNVRNLELGTANPLAELTQIGYRLIDTSIKATRLDDECRATERDEMAQKQAATGMAYIDSPYTCNSTGSFLTQAATGAMVSAGVMLAFILPLIPFIRFLFGILAWVLAMFETVIAIPIVALAHIKMDGEGLAGPGARTAYLLMLQLFLRPVLMIFGLILALILFNFMIVVLNEFFSGAIRGVENGGPLAAVSSVIYALMYGMLAYSFATASFKAVDIIPAQCLQWIGGSNSAISQEAEMVGRSVGGSVSSIGSQAMQMESRAIANGRV